MTTSFSSQWDEFYSFCSRTNSNRINLVNETINGFLSNKATYRSYSQYDANYQLTKNRVEWRKRFLLDKNAMNIGAIPVSVPVTDINFATTKEVSMVNTVRTPLTSAIRRATEKTTFIIRLVFPDQDAINNVFRHIIAQQVVSPILPIRSRHLTSMALPYNAGNAMYYEKYLGFIKRINVRVPTDSELETIYTDVAPLYSIDHIDVQPIPEQVDAIQMNMIVTLVDDTMFGKTEGIRFLKDDAAVIDQLAWVRNKYIWVRENREKLNKLMDMGILSYSPTTLTRLATNIGAGKQLSIKSKTTPGEIEPTTISKQATDTVQPNIDYEKATTKIYLHGNIMYIAMPLDKGSSKCFAVSNESSDEGEDYGQIDVSYSYEGDVTRWYIFGAPITDNYSAFLNLNPSFVDKLGLSPGWLFKDADDVNTITNPQVSVDTTGSGIWLTEDGIGTTEGYKKFIGAYLGEITNHYTTVMNPKEEKSLVNIFPYYAFTPVPPVKPDFKYVELYPTLVTDSTKFGKDLTKSNKDLIYVRSIKDKVELEYKLYLTYNQYGNGTFEAEGVETLYDNDYADTFRWMAVCDKVSSPKENNWYHTPIHTYIKNTFISGHIEIITCLDPRHALQKIADYSSSYTEIIEITDRFTSAFSINNNPTLPMLPIPHFGTKINQINTDLEMLTKAADLYLLKPEYQNKLIEVVDIIAKTSNYSLMKTKLSAMLAAYDIGRLFLKTKMSATDADNLIKTWTTNNKIHKSALGYVILSMIRVYHKEKLVGKQFGFQLYPLNVTNGAHTCKLKISEEYPSIRSASSLVTLTYTPAQIVSVCETFINKCYEDELYNTNAKQNKSVSQQFIGDIKNFYKSKSTDTYIKKLQLHHGLLTPTAAMSNSIDRKDVIENPIGKNSPSYVAYTTKHIEESLPFIKYYRSILRESQDISRNNNFAYAYKINENYPSILEEYNPSPDARAIKLFYKTVNPDTQNILFLTDKPVSDPDLISNTDKISSNDLIGVRTKLRGLPNNRESASYTFLTLIMSEQLKDITKAYYEPQSDANPFIKRLVSVINIPKLESIRYSVINDSLYKEVSGSTKKVQDEIVTYRILSTITNYLIDMAFEKRNPLHMTAELIANIIVGSSEFNKTITTSEIIKSVDDAFAYGIDLTDKISDADKAILISALKNILGPNFHTDLSYYLDNLGKRNNTYVDPIKSLLIDINDDITRLAGKVNKYLSLKKESVPIDTVIKFENLYTAYTKLYKDANKRNFIKKNMLNSVINGIKSKIENYNNFSMSRILGTGCNAYDSIVGMLGIQAKDSILSSENFDSITKFSIAVSEYLAAIQSLMVKSPFKWAELSISDVPLKGNQIVNNLTSNQFLKQTTITDYRISRENDNVHIYRDGNIRPSVQNFGGGNVNISLSFMSCDDELLLSLVEAAISMDIPLRQSTMMEYRSPFIGNAENRAAYSKLMSITNNYFQQISGTSPTSQAAFDIPLIIQNNIANMMGIKNCVISQISLNTTPNNPNYMNVMIEMIGTNAGLKDFETPTYESPSFDTSPFYGLFSSLVNMDLSTSEFSTYVDTMKSINEKMLRGFLFLEMVNVLAVSVNSLCLAKRRQINMGSLFDEDKQSFGSTAYIPFTSGSDDLTLKVGRALFNPVGMMTQAKANINYMLSTLLRTSYKESSDILFSFLKNTKESLKFLMGTATPTVLDPKTVLINYMENAKYTKITPLVSLLSQLQLYDAISDYSSLYQALYDYIQSFKVTSSTRSNGYGVDIGTNISASQLLGLTTLAKFDDDIFKNHVVNTIKPNAEQLKLFKTLFDSTKATLYTEIQNKIDSYTKLTAKDALSSDGAKWDEFFETLLNKNKQGFLSLVTSLKRDPNTFQVSFAENAMEITRTEKADTGFWGRLENSFSSIPGAMENVGVLLEGGDRSSAAEDISKAIFSILDTNDFLIFNIFEDFQKTVSLFSDKIINILAAYNTINQSSVLAKEPTQVPKIKNSDDTNETVISQFNITDVNIPFITPNLYYEGYVANKIPKELSGIDVANVATIYEITNTFRQPLTLKNIMLSKIVDETALKTIRNECDEIDKVAKHVYNICNNASIGIVTKNWRQINDSLQITNNNFYLVFPGEVVRRLINIIDVTNGMTPEKYAINFGKDFERVKVNMKTNHALLNSESKKTKKEDERIVRLINYTVMYSPSVYDPKTKQMVQPRYDNITLTDIQNLIVSCHYILDRIIHQNRSDIIEFEFLATLQEYEKTKVTSYDIPDNYMGFNYIDAIKKVTTDLMKANNVTSETKEIKEKARNQIIENIKNTVSVAKHRNESANRLTRQWRDKTLSELLDKLYHETNKMGSTDHLILTILMLLFKAKKKYNLSGIYRNDSWSWLGKTSGSTAEIDSYINQLFLSRIFDKTNGLKKIAPSIYTVLWMPNINVTTKQSNSTTAPIVSISFRELADNAADTGAVVSTLVDVVMVTVDIVLICMSLGLYTPAAVARSTAVRGARALILRATRNAAKTAAAKTASRAASTVGRNILVRGGITALKSSRFLINSGIQLATRAIDIGLLLNSEGDFKSIFTTMVGFGATRAIRRGVSALSYGVHSGKAVLGNAIRGAQIGFVGGSLINAASAIDSSGTVQSGINSIQNTYMNILKMVPLMNVITKIFPYTPLSIDAIINSAPFTFSLYYKEATVDNYIESQFVPAVANGAFPAPSDILGHLLVEMNGWDDMLNRFFDMKTAYKDLPIPVFTELTDAEKNASYLTNLKNQLRQTLGKTTTNNQSFINDSERFLLKQIYSFTDPAFYLYKSSSISEAERRDINQKQKESSENLLRSSDDKSIVMQQVIADSISKLELELLSYQQEVRSFAIRVQSENGDATYYNEICTAFGASVPLYETRQPKTVEKDKINDVDSADKRDQEITKMAIEKWQSSMGELKVTSEQMNKIARMTLAIKGTSGNNLYSEFMSLNDKRIDMNNKIRTLRSIYMALSNGMSDKRAYDMMMQIMKPYEGITSDHTMELSEYYFDEAIRNSARRDVSGTPVCGYPAFKIYFIEEDNKRLHMFNDFFSYASVQSIDVFQSKHHAADTAVIRVTNTYGNLTNIMSAKLSNENPFMGAIEENQNISAIMLKPGCMVQIRLGYKAILNEDEIVFTGEITDIQGDELLTITCQGHGAPLTQVIGTGEGFTAGGVLEAINYGLNRVRSILFQLIDAVDGMDRLGGKTIRGNMNEIYHDDVMPLVNTIGYDILHSGLKSVLGEDNYKNIVGDVIDTKWRNILLHEDSGIGQAFVTNWLVYNETAWDSLQDFCLQFPNTICTVRPYDDEATLIIADRDDYYQYTDVTLGSNKYLFDSIKKLRKVIENKEQAIAYIHRAFIGLNGNKDAIRENRGIVALYLTGVMQLMRMYGQFGSTDDIDVIKTKINKVYETIDGQLKAGDESSMITIATKEISRIYESLYENQSPSSDSEDAQFDAAVQSLLENALTAKTTINEINRAVLMKKQGMVKNETNTESLDKTIEKLDAQSNYDMYTKLATELLIDTQHHINGSIAYMVCKILLKKTLAASSQHKLISESHYKSSESTIIKNDITLQDGYNKVKMTFIDKNMAATSLDSITGGLFNIAAMNIRNIDNPSAHREINIVASSSLRPSGVNTYTTFQKNASALEELFTERKYAVGNQILANLMRDYYGGTLTIMGDPYIKPYHRIFVDDKKRDMWGFIGVKEVHHMLSKETGFVTVITPEMEISTRFNPSQGYGAGTEIAMAVMKGVDIGLKIWGVTSLFKFGTNLFKMEKLTESIRKPLMDAVAKTASKEAAEKLASAPLLTLINQGLSYKAMGGGLLGFSVATAKWAGLYKLAKAFPTPLTDMDLKLGDFMNIQPINAMPLMYKGQLFIANMDGVKRSDRSRSGIGSFLNSLTVGFDELVMGFEHIPQSISSSINYTLDNIKNPVLNQNRSRIQLD